MKKQRKLTIGVASEDRPVQDPQDGIPSVHQIAWVFRHLRNHFMRTGPYSKLIYDRMGLDESAYQTLYEAGGMYLSNCAYSLSLFEHAQQEGSLEGDDE